MPLPKFATLLLLEADAPDGARMTDGLGEARAADADVPDGTGTTDTSGKAGVANAPGGTGKLIPQAELGCQWLMFQVELPVGGLIAQAKLPVGQWIL